MSMFPQSEPKDRPARLAVGVVGAGRVGPALAAALQLAAGARVVQGARSRAELAQLRLQRHAAGYLLRRAAGDVEQQTVQRSAHQLRVVPAALRALTGVVVVRAVDPAAQQLFVVLVHALHHPSRH
ncbi:hypothetical protein AB0885_18720 [Streptomyces sp. NPDC005534]|uniref:hypothetical protein n=1 Tax=Streptomyces sp. NPDC005534 TaxID=3155714 RepID=UPI0034556D72